MSNRSIAEKRDDYRNPRKKFLPETDFQTPNSRQTLSNSFRAATTNAAAESVYKSSPSGNFVIYLPQDEAVAAGLKEGGLNPADSQRVVDLLNKQLSGLLKLRPKDFWREVATDESLYVFLESFLKFRSRWYDFPYRGARGVVAGVIVGEFELCRRVFMVLYRLASNRDPGAKAADTLSSKDHAALLQDKKLLDLPKLLDICAIYGHENEDLTRILVMNAMTVQPYIQDDFPVLISHFLSIVQTMYQRCSSSLEVLLASGGQDQGSSRLHLDYLEVMDFINDAVVSMDSFVNAYKHAAVFFSSPVDMSYGNDELLAVLGRLHDSLLPSLQKGFQIIFAEMENKNQEMSSELRSNVSISLKMLSARIVKFGWKLIYFCYLSDEAFESSHSLPVSMKMFPATVDPMVRADILIQAIRDLCGGYTHVPVVRNWGTFIQNIEKNHSIMNRIELLQKTGWMPMDNEQVQFLAGILIHPLETDTKVKAPTSLPVTGNGTHTDENAAIIESQISQIKELFPDYGRGFLVACLEAYNQNAEEVIQRILEGTLHEELQSLDISLESIPPPNSTSSVSNKNDKGKGKLVESAVSPNTAAAIVKTQTGFSSSSSSSSFGRFVRKNTNESPDSDTLNDKKERELAKTTALVSQQLEYEDEYDDSFDDLGLSVGDSGLDEPESLGDKMNSQRGRSNEVDGSSSTSNADKWNSRKKPQFYVKDGKNYSYKVDGSVAVSNFNEAKLVNLAQKELVHGLGRGGNLPLGAVKRLTESNEEQDDARDTEEVGGRGGVYRGRGRRGFHSGTIKRPQESNDEQDNARETDEIGGRGGRGNSRGGGRRGRGGNHNRRDRAMSKHLSGLPGHYKT
ncbi:hypothetical protein ACJIZ3_025074 [Penstemon smallii]|uniref:CUE domain-containing protein n=1 Tax=Penstemon smallii TaxID=265156 RepID=A0ABD3TWY2_9LAMI